MNFPHWSRLITNSLLFLLGYYFPLSLWKFAYGFSPLGCLPATAEKKRKKRKASNRISRPLYCCLCVYMLESYIILFHFLVLLYSSRWCCPCECMELFSPLQLIVVFHLALFSEWLCEGVLVAFSCLLLGSWSCFLAILLHISRGKHELVCVFRKALKKLCKKATIHNAAGLNTNVAWHWRFFSFWGIVLFYCYVCFCLLHWLLCEDWTVFHPFLCLSVFL